MLIIKKGHRSIRSEVWQETTRKSPIESWRVWRRDQGKLRLAERYRTRIENFREKGRVADGLSLPAQISLIWKVFRGNLSFDSIAGRLGLRSDKVRAGFEGRKTVSPG
ncbi:MAG: hypothetical protein P8017_08105 [Deltaproteobacteria bacterium]